MLHSRHGPETHSNPAAGEGADVGLHVPFMHSEYGADAQNDPLGISEYIEKIFMFCYELYTCGYISMCARSINQNTAKIVEQSF